MLNMLWAVLMLAGIGYGLVTGQAAAVTAAILDGAADGIRLCITMFGVIALWSGVMEIAERAGLVQRLSRAMEPALRLLFPEIPRGHPALNAIAVNFTANILGLGWAATPAGLRAMEELTALEESRRKEGRGLPSEVASREMCTFLILNVSSLQLIPVTMLAYRRQYGSANPAAIVGPAIAATAISTLAAILFCLFQNQRKSQS